MRNHQRPSLFSGNELPRVEPLIGVIGTLSALTTVGGSMRNSESVSHKSRTPIERIFYNVFKREMITAERRVLLAKPKNVSK